MCDTLRVSDASESIVLPAVDSGGDLTLGVSKLLSNLGEALDSVNQD